MEVITLDNGLKIYLYEDKKRHTTFFQFITLFGGMTKDFSFDGDVYHLQDGIAHILEHYIVECNNGGNLLEELGNKEMNTNASTHNNMTRFYFDTVFDVGFGIRTLLKGIYDVDFREEKLEKLKNPICQEIRGRFDNKFYHSNIMTINNLFKNIKFRNIGGTLEEVKKTSISDLKLCYEAFYRPENQFIVVAGNFSREEVLEEIKSFYKELKLDYHDVLKLDIIENSQVSVKEDVLEFPTPLDYVEVSFKVDISKYSTLEKLDLDFYLGCFYNQFFGITSPLYKELIDKKIIPNVISCGDMKIGEFLVISIGAYTYCSDYFKKRILEEVKLLRYFDREKFSLDRNNAIIRLILRDENIKSMILPLVDNIVTFDYPELDKVSDIEKTDYDSFISQIKSLDFSNYTITIIKEKK